MGDKVKIRAGHLNITDHLILGITKDRLDKKQENFQYADLQTMPMVGWPELVTKLETDELDGAFILAPSAMDLYKSGVPIGSISIKAGHGEVFSLSKDLWPKHPCCVFVVKEKFIDTRFAKAASA
jgi:NitT/TauT family transport system substrate-binding protein